jgi:hypothetical protein
MLGEPPSRWALRSLPTRRLDRLRLWRVHRATRGPWWFSSLSPEDPGRSGRFDLPAPNGSCYLASTRTTAILEALQDFGGGLLPAAALKARVISNVEVPAGAPHAAALTAAKAAAVGVNVGLWADRDRMLTHAWAAELHGAGWQALHHGAQHDPTGRGRSVTLFDHSGAHPAWGGPWLDPQTVGLDNWESRAVLARYGITVEDMVSPDLEVLDHPVVEGG